MNQKKNEFYSKNRKLPKNLEEIADRIMLEDEMIFEYNSDYQGTRIDLKDLNIMMNQMINVMYKEMQKSKKQKVISGNDDDKELCYVLKGTAAIKNILDFLKDFDNELYVKTLETLIGLKEDSVEIYSINDKRVEEKELPKAALNILDNGTRSIYLPLCADFEQEKIITNYVKSDEFAFADMFALLHELSHGFDRDLQKEKVDSDVLFDKYHREKLPTITGTYLTETTAILFENLFADYLLQENPEYKVLTDQISHKRLNENFRTIRETGFKSALVRRRKDDKPIDDNFVNCIKEYYGVTLKGLKNVYTDSYLFASRKYALAQLLVPTMMEEYVKDREEGKNKVKNYLECCKNNDFDGALASFGININDKDSYNYLLDNYKKTVHMHKGKENKTEIKDEENR